MSSTEKPVASLPDTRSNFLADFSASIVVFLVAVPLCMGIAIASDVPIQYGLISGIVGGLVVGFLGGSAMQVSGPAAGLTVLIYGIVHDPQLGLPMLGIIVVGAGIIQISAGLFRLGRWFRAVSPAVIQGMLAGIGVLIFASQFHVMVDDDPRKNGLLNLVSIPESFWKGITPSSDVVHDEAAQIGILTLAILLLWKNLLPKKIQMIPAPLVAIVVATIAVTLLAWPIQKVDIAGLKLIHPQPNALERLFEEPGVLSAVLVAMASVAFIASAETLLCATAVDQLHQGPRTNYNRELFAQGIGNTICGFIGGLPMTGVIVRSAANVEAGAKTRMSAILHGVWLLLFVAAFPFVLNYIPKAALAAVLVYTGYKLMNITAIRELWKYGKGEVFIYAATVITIVSVGLLAGVVLGIVISALRLLYVFSHLAIEMKDDPENNRTVLHAEGAATFIRLPVFEQALKSVPRGRELHINLELLTFIDHACLDMLMSWEKQHEATGGSLIMDWATLRGRFGQMNNNHKKQNASEDGSSDAMSA